MPAEEYPFQDEWEYYQFLQAAPFILIFLWILGVILAAFLINYFLLVETTLQGIIIGILFVGFIVLNVLTLTLFLLWRCPKCQKRFFLKSPLDFFFGSRNLFWRRECVHCELPKYYGSSYFYNHWGTEKGNELIRKIKGQEAGDR